MPARLGRVALVIGVAIRLVLVCRSLEALDDLFVPDDTYYTLGIARELALGHGPSVDGMTLTNGFQALQAFLVVPAFWLGASADGGLRAAIVVSALADIGALFAVAALARRAGGTTAGAIAAAAWAWSPLALTNALNGLETSLTVGLVTGALAFWQAERDVQRESVPRNVVRSVFLGVLWGLAVLARIDAGIAALFFGIVALRERRLRFVAIVGAAALVTVAGWWLYELAHFGTVVPESGQAVREIAAMHRAMSVDTRRQIAWTTGTLVGAPFWLWPALRHTLYESAAASVGALVVWTGSLASGTRRVLARVGGRTTALPILVLLAWGAAVALLYTFYVPAIWFFTRYLLPCAAALTVGIAIVVASLLEDRTSRRLRPIVQIALGVFLVAGAAGSARFFTTPGASADSGLDGAKGYRRASREVLALVPDGAVVGSLQSGALGYYGRGKVRVVNLDGVVDAEAAKAFASSTLAELAERRGVDVFVDWPFNKDVFERRSGDARERITWTPLGSASPQGEDAMAVWSLRRESRSPR